MAVARYYDHDRGEWVLLAAGRDGVSGASSWDDLTDKPATFPPETHTHSQYATTSQVEARTPEIRVVSSPEQATSPGVLYVVMED